MRRLRATLGHFGDYENIFPDAARSEARALQTRIVTLSDFAAIPDRGCAASGKD
jgi:hypothetical protein